MRILFLTQVLPYPLDAGPKTRAYYVLRYLAQGHEITLVSFVRETDTAAAINHLATLCHDIYTIPMLRSRAQDVRFLARSLLSDTPFLIARDTVPEMTGLIQCLVADADYDIVHADQLWMAPYALLARESVTGRLPRLVLDQHNAVFQIPRRLKESEKNPAKRWLLDLEARKMARYEADVCRHFDHVVWVTAEDRAAVGVPEVPSTVIPICVDPDSQQPIRRTANPQRVTFLGGLHWPPNAEGIVWFAREVWPSVRKQAPNAVLTVIGKDPPGELQSPRAKGSGIEAMGYVADPQPYLQETGVFVVPLHAGGGMRVKILDAWARALPVVTTRIGAEGIGVRDGENVLLADTAEAFANAVVRVLQNLPLAEHVADAGRRTIETEYNWRRVYGAWDEVYMAAGRNRVGLPCFGGQMVLS